MVQAGGLEPPAYFLGGSRSILMSYACACIFINKNACKSKLFFSNSSYNIIVLIFR